MSHVWTSIAFSSPCRQARAKPLRKLFTGYARSQTARYGSTCVQHRPQPARELPVRRGDQQRLFSTTPFFAQKGAAPRRSPPPPKADPPVRLSKASDSAKEEQEEGIDVVVNRAESEAAKAADLGRKKVPSQDTSQAKPDRPLELETEELTWRDFDPAGGMPLPNDDADLPQDKINEIFGKEQLDVETGNYVLRVLHWRRMSGALIDVGLQFPKDTGVTQVHAEKGLVYVRSLLPDFDEVAAGAVWAEEETERQREELRARAVKLGIYKDDAEPQAEEEVEDEPQQGTKESQLQRIRRQNEQQWEKEKAEAQAKKEREELAAMQKQRGPLELSAGVQPTAALTKSERPKLSKLERAVHRSEWEKYEEQAYTIKDNVLPDVPSTRRLGPSFAVLVATLAGCYFFAEYYTPPPKSARLWPDTPPTVATLGALTGLFLTTFVLARFPPAWKFVNKYLTIVPANPYSISILGATFRHDEALHLLFNMGFFWYFGLKFHEDVGRGNFLALFFASSAMGGFSSLAYHVLQKRWTVYMFGCSASVWAILSAWCTMRSNGEVRGFGTEMPGATWILLAVSALWQAVALRRGVSTNVDHVGHLSGIITGVAAGLWLSSVAQPKTAEKPVLKEDEGESRLSRDDQGKSGNGV
jgi:rhomboid-like protein